MTMGPVWAPHFIDVIADQAALSASATQTDITTLSLSLSLFLVLLLPTDDFITASSPLLTLATCWTQTNAMEEL